MKILYYNCQTQILRPGDLRNMVEIIRKKSLVPGLKGSHWISRLSAGNTSVMTNTDIPGFTQEVEKSVNCDTD